MADRPTVHDSRGPRRRARDIPRERLFRDLIAIELDHRRLRGEHPEPGEYRDSFPELAAQVDRIFKDPEGSSAPASERPEPWDEGRRAVARDLLLGLLGWQNGFLGGEALVEALRDRGADPSRHLGPILREQGVLDASHFALLEALAAEHLRLRGDDPEASLAALSSIDPVRNDLARLDDPDLRACLAVVSRRRFESDQAGIDGENTPMRHADGRFRILRLHAKGGLGQVFVARDETLNREVALKEIQPEKADLSAHRARFLREAEITSLLQHPGIVPIYGLGTYADGRPFYSMRFIEGDSFRDAIRAYHAEHPKPDPSTVGFRTLLQRFVDVCEAIAYAHSKGVLHRDLKPHNIMIGRYGEALIIDWGLARAIGNREQATADPRSLGK